MLVQSLYDQLCDREHLKKCWKSIYSNKTKDMLRFSRGIDEVSLKDFKQNADERLLDLHRRLVAGSFEFSKMKPIPKKKKSGGKRILSVPTVEDRIIHKAMLSVLTPKLYSHINTGVSYCGVKQDHWKKEEHGVSIKKAMEKMVRHVKKGHTCIFETDIQGFFDNVPKEKMLERIFSVLHDDTSLNDCIKQVVCFELGNVEALLRKGIPLPNEESGLSQGSALSPIFANLYLADFDRAMKEKYGDRFVRYVDDFIVVCNTLKEAQEAKSNTVELLKCEGLAISPDGEKTREVELFDNEQKVDFLGIRISRHCIRPTRTNSELRDWLTTKVLNKSAYEPTFRDGKRMTVQEQTNERIQAWGLYYRFYHVEDVFAVLDAFLERRKNGADATIKGIENLSSIELIPLVNIEEWRSYFNRKG